MATQLAQQKNKAAECSDSTVRQVRLARMQWIRWSRGLPTDG